jgi:hypothetical protein
MPKLVWRDGSREVWDMGDGTFQVITPLGTFICPSLDSAHYQLQAGQVFLVKGGKANGFTVHRRQGQDSGHDKA